MFISAQNKFQSIILPEKSFLQDLGIVILASIFLDVISQMAIHLWMPVPITLQSAAVIFLGLTLGSKRAAAAVVAYLVQGFLGAPVFAGGLFGLAILVGPSGGYLYGFLPAAFLAGLMMEKGMARSFIGTYFTALLSASVIFLIGVSHLQLMTGWKQAYELGVAPFLVTEPIKLLIVSFLATFCWKKC